MSRSIDEVQYIGRFAVQFLFFAIVELIHLNGVALDGDAALLFKVHVIEHLPLCNLDGVGAFQQSVGNGALSMVNVGDDAEVSDMFHGHS